MQTTSNQWGVIVWHTGVPDKVGDYLVTVKTDEGDIFVMADSFESNCMWWGCDPCRWEVLAWCPIKNIKPYKED
jgi:hypothetical protein